MVSGLGVRERTEPGMTMRVDCDLDVVVPGRRASRKHGAAPLHFNIC
jgi:hypothetical protein